MLIERSNISAEEAGVGFALSVVNAERYNGQEIGSIQALMDAGVFESGKPYRVLALVRPMLPFSCRTSRTWSMFLKSSITDGFIEIYLSGNGCCVISKRRSAWRRTILFIFRSLFAAEPISLLFKLK